MRSDLYRRPDGGSRRVAVQDRRAREVEKCAISEPQAPISVDRATECHVTPPPVAARMVAALGAVSGRIIEPSAGTGALVAALLESGVDAARIVMVERHIGLSNALARRFPAIELRNADFLEEAQEFCGAFAACVINPPFSVCKKHIEAAISVVQPGGVIVALVPVTFSNPHAETLETLPPDTFAAARVNTKIIRIRKGT